MPVSENTFFDIKIRVAAEEQLSVDELIEDLRSAGKEAFSIEGADAIVEHLTPQLRPDDVVVVMSNGGFGGIHEKLLDALKPKR